MHISFMIYIDKKDIKKKNLELQIVQNIYQVKNLSGKELWSLQDGINQVEGYPFLGQIIRKYI